MANREYFLLFALVMSGVINCCGCNGHEGPQRFELSGTVTYHGQPVPMGYLTFTPDKSKGNSGPGTHADIRDGQYRTLDGRGIVGGPHIVMISGFDGTKKGDSNPLGRPLSTQIQVKADLPHEKSTYDFEVPIQ